MRTLVLCSAILFAAGVACSDSDGAPNTDIDRVNGPEGNTNSNGPANNAGSGSGNSANTSTTGTPSGSSTPAGSSTSSNIDSSNQDTADEDEESFNWCETYDFRPDPEPAPTTGTAQLSLPATDDAEARNVDLTEVTCETFHDEAGNTVGYGASFFATWENTSFTPQYAAVTWFGEFTGDGEYADASLSEEGGDLYDRPNSFGRGTLTLSEGGRVGSITTSSGIALNFSCGDTSKISVGPKQWSAELAPGTLRVAGGPEGVVYEISGIDCGQEASDDFVIRLDSPFEVSLITLDESAADGEHQVRVNFNYAGLGGLGPGDIDTGDMNLTCGSAANGTLDFGVGPGYTGRFVCQE